MEKLNDDCRRVHLHRSNKWDVAKDVLVVGKRVEELASDCQRNRRQYVKVDQIYWRNGIVETRGKQQIISMEIPEEPNSNDIDLEKLSLAEIKNC